jgi:ATP-dependent exoDNAse (exonuclease V) beta subunit
MAKDLADALLIADGGSLPTKISVSALKRYAVDEDGEVTGEPYSSQVKPRAFRRTDGAADTGSPAEPGRRKPAARSGAAFGTLMHLVMKWAVEDRASWPEAPGDAARYAAELIRRKLDGGFLSVEEAALADPEMLAGFISSPRGREVRAAENVRCEVPFTYMTDVRKYVGAAEKVLKNAPPGDVPGEPAEDRAGYAPEELREGPAEPAAFFKNNLKEEKNIVIQGVVDLYYKLQDRVVIVDFKTDRIRGRGDADNIAAYRMQLTCYRDALADISGENIQECVLYFLRGGQEYSV